MEKYEFILDQMEKRMSRMEKRFETDLTEVHRKLDTLLQFKWKSMGMFCIVVAFAGVLLKVFLK